MMTAAKDFNDYKLQALKEQGFPDSAAVNVDLASDTVTVSVPTKSEVKPEAKPDEKKKP